MKVDAHVHFWRLSRGVNTALSPDMAAIYTDREPSHLTAELDLAGIDRLVVVQASETLGENLFMAGLAEASESIAGIVGWVDPGSASLVEELAALTQMPRMKGVRPVREDNVSIIWMLDPDLDEGWSRIASSGLVIDLLVQNWRELRIVSLLAERFPQATFVLDHVGKPDIVGGRFEDWAADITEIADRPNVVCKLSGLMNCAPRGADADLLRPWCDHVIEAFSTRRVLWASDWPPLDLVSTYAAWAEISEDLLSGLSTQDRDRVFGGNAVSVYSLQD